MTLGDAIRPLVFVSSSAGVLVLLRVRSGRSACGIRVPVMPALASQLSQPPPCPVLGQENHQEASLNIGVCLFISILLYTRPSTGAGGQRGPGPALRKLLVQQGIPTNPQRWLHVPVPPVGTSASSPNPEALGDAHLQGKASRESELRRGAGEPGAAIQD